MKYTGTLVFAIAACTAPTTKAFAPSQTLSSRVLSAPSSTGLDGHNVSRRNAFGRLLAPTLAIATASFSHPTPANADVTNKVASQASLRYIKRSIRELDRLEFVATSNDYSGIKEGLRSPGLSEVRKNANIIIRGGEDGPEAENLQKAYSTFIKDIETLDGEASLGFRGKKGVDMTKSYDKSVKDLASFVEVAERSVTVPVQYSE